MSQAFRYCLLLSITFSLVVCTGCSDGLPYKVVPFEGTISYKGEPLENISVEFAVGDYRTSGCFIAVGDQGKFKAIHSPSIVGIPVGQCTMKVGWGGGEGSTPPGKYPELFAKYGYTSAGYTFEVTKAEKGFKIDLE